MVIIFDVVSPFFSWTLIVSGSISKSKFVEDLLTLLEPPPVALPDGELGSLGVSSVEKLAKPVTLNSNVLAV